MKLALVIEKREVDREGQEQDDVHHDAREPLREHDLREAVEAVVELTAVEMQETGVRVALELSPEPVMVLIDAELVRQALLNLLLNGMQAMPEGGTMRVAVYREHQFAVVEVEDEGEGIPAELLPRIFELYFTTKVKGSGIGLAMTYRILQMHGGALDVRSNADPEAPDHGTTFTLQLPISAGTPEPRKTPVVSGRRMTGEQA